MRAGKPFVFWPGHSGFLPHGSGSVFFFSPARKKNLGFLCSSDLSHFSPYAKGSGSGWSMQF